MSRLVAVARTCLSVMFFYESKFKGFYSVCFMVCLFSIRIQKDRMLTNRENRKNSLTLIQVESL